MQYLVNNKRYNLNYQELKDSYNEFISIPDDEFLDRITQVIHLACVICYLKETPNEYTLSDEGIIHQLVHLIDIPDEPMVDIKEIRDNFTEILKLS